MYHTVSPQADALAISSETVYVQSNNIRCVIQFCEESGPPALLRATDTLAEETVVNSITNKIFIWVGLADFNDEAELYPGRNQIVEAAASEAGCHETVEAVVAVMITGLQDVGPL